MSLQKLWALELSAVASEQVAANNSNMTTAKEAELTRLLNLSPGGDDANPTAALTNVANAGAGKGRLRHQTNKIIMVNCWLEKLCWYNNVQKSKANLTQNMET